MINFFKIRLPRLPVKPRKYCWASLLVVRAKQSLNWKLDPAAFGAEFAKQQTRKQCKRPSAKWAPGRHPGLFLISRLFRARFPIDVSPVKRSNHCFGLGINDLFQEICDFSGFFKLVWRFMFHLYIIESYLIDKSGITRSLAYKNLSKEIEIRAIYLL